MSASLAQNAAAPRYHAAFGASVLKFPEAPRRAGALQPAPQCIQYAQDSGIYEEGGAAGCFYKIVSGVVRTCRFSSDGRRHIDAFYTAGDVFGFELGATHMFSAEAVTDCIVTPCRRRGVEAGVAQDEARDEVGAMQLFTYAMGQLERARAHSQLLGRCSAVQKLAVFLLEFAGRKANATVELPMARQDIADYLGMTIETVSRTLAHLEKTGVIRLEAARHIILCNRAVLEDLCG